MAADQVLWPDGLVSLLDESCSGLDASAVALVSAAAAKSVDAHQGQSRRSGEPYVFHPASVAVLVRKIGLGPEAVAAAWLHDVVEDTDVTLEQIHDEFGADVGVLVDGLTKVDGLRFDTAAAEQAEQMRRLLLHLAADPRAVVVKICDRLHNMRTVWALDAVRRERVARETLLVFAPLAHRLGYASIRAELEDLAFAVLWPERHAELAAAFEHGAPERDRLVQAALVQLETVLGQAGLPAQVTGRAKHLYAIAEKIQRSGIPLDQLHDLFGLRVIVDDTDACYRALGAIHCSSQFQPVPGSFKDYIAVPRVGLYSSLHTVVVGPGGHRFEVQIRSQAMHEAAERGPAAHWRYKQGVLPSGDTDTDPWVEALIDGLDGTLDLQELRVELDEDEVYTFTPKGDMVRLPGGACVLDFAYAIHSQVGAHAFRATVNGVDVPLTTPLRHGDRVEIVTEPAAVPSPEWFDAVVTGRARSALRAALRRQDPDDAFGSGQARLHGWGVASDLWPQVAERLGYGDVDRFVRAVGEHRLGRVAVCAAAGRSTDRVVAVEVEAVDRSGLLAEVTAAISSEQGDILTSRSHTRDRRAFESYTVALPAGNVGGLEQRVRSVPGVVHVTVSAVSSVSPSRR